MTFYTFMMRNHRDAASPKGDLARDMMMDRERFPRNGPGKRKGWHRLIREHLEGCGACEGCLDIFEECWEDYVECEKSRSKKRS